MSLVPDPTAAAESVQALRELNAWLAGLDARRRVEWALESLSGEHALSSSFGAQSAVALHLSTRVRPDLPVILVDTGYLFPETYRFVDELTHRLDLSLHVVRPDPAQAWGPAAIASLESLGAAGIDRYNRVHKVEPMQRALRQLGVRTWIAGLRRGQSRTRANIDILEIRDGRWKLHPLADWTDRDVGQYLARHGLPYHPLWQQGYVSIGDVHSTRTLAPGMDAEETRFFGLRRECGLHFDAPVSGSA
jgi:phosphoadenosine phosphosulfate reductase